MKMPILVLGVVVLVAGLGTWGYLYSMNIHHTIQLGGIALAVVGAIIAAGGAIMKTVSGGARTGAGQLACAKCGAKFNSAAASNQHSKDPHGMEDVQPAIRGRPADCGTRPCRNAFD